VYIQVPILAARLAVQITVKARWRNSLQPEACGASSPRLMVERASPVILETIARAPRPAVRTSIAANNRRPRSSSFAPPTASQRCRIASARSCDRPTPVRAPRNPPGPSHSVAEPENRDSIIVRSVLIRQGRRASAATPTAPSR
jgi:hypothetical protein